MDIQIKIGEITGFVEEAPIVSEQSLEVSSVVRAGGVYLVGALERQRSSNGRGGGLGLVKKEVSLQASMHVWLRCYRIAGDAIIAQQEVKENEAVIIAPATSN